MTYPAERDNNLPEVVPDGAPQAMSSMEAEYKQHMLDGQDPKYPVAYDDAPKIPDVPTMPTMHQNMMNAAQNGEYHYPLSAQTMSPNSSVPWDHYSAFPPSAEPGESGTLDEKKKPVPMIFGFKRRTFIIILVIAVVVIAAGVGGGVGGGIAASKNNEGTGNAATTSGSGAATQTPPSTSTTSSTTTTTSTTTTSAAPSQTFLSNTTVGQGFGFQGFSGFNFTGQYTPIIDSEGAHDLGFDVNSYVWIPGQTQCCLNFCLNATTSTTNYWCGFRRQYQASGPFPWIYVFCDHNMTRNQTCSDPEKRAATPRQGTKLLIDGWTA